MVEEIQKEQTLDSEKKEAEKTEDTAKEQAPKTFTEDDLNRIVKERLDRERKKYANHADLEAKAKKLDEIEKAKLSEDERIAAKLKEREDKIAELDKEIEKRRLRDLKRSKIEQAIADGKMVLPTGKTIDSLVNRSTATKEEDIDSDIEDLIGFFPKAPPSKSQGAGTQIADTPGSGKKTVDDEMAEIRLKLKDAALSMHDKEILAKKLLSLGNQKMLNF